MAETLVRTAGDCPAAAAVAQMDIILAQPETDTHLRAVLCSAKSVLNSSNLVNPLAKTRQTDLPAPRLH